MYLETICFRQTSQTKVLAAHVWVHAICLRARGWCGEICARDPVAGTCTFTQRLICLVRLRNGADVTNTRELRQILEHSFFKFFVGR
jgi:hypothetical protein